MVGGAKVKGAVILVYGNCVHNVFDTRKRIGVQESKSIDSLRVVDHQSTFLFILDH